MQSVTEIWLLLKQFASANLSQKFMSFMMWEEFVVKGKHFLFGLFQFT